MAVTFCPSPSIVNCLYSKKRETSERNEDKFIAADEKSVTQSLVLVAAAADQSVRTWWRGMENSSTNIREVESS